MNLDKHDIFRNAVPGFVFLIVILSFYAVTGSLENIHRNQEALVGLVAGFPLGFVIHSLYRIVFHVWSGEQARMDEQEALWVDDTILRGLPREKAHYLMFRMCESKNQNWKDRIDFLYSYIHALGASALAIVLALAFIFTIKYPLSCALCCFNSCIPFYIFLMAVIWVIVAVIFYLGRQDVKETFRISAETFCKVELKLHKPN